MNSSASTQIEEVLQDTAELLWRNVHPSFVDQGRITSQAFRPTPKDQKKLSGAREAKVSAARHYEEFTTTLGLQSLGVWAVTVGELHGGGIRAVYDENTPSAPNPCPTGHAYFDFGELSSGHMRRTAGFLRDKAEQRGCQHPPSAERQDDRSSSSPSN